MDRAARIRIVVLAIIFGVLTVFSVHWTQSAQELGQDFRVYFNAAQNALNGRSAYLPYEPSASFLYHPSVLSMLSVLTGLPFWAAFAVWSMLSLAAYIFSIYLLFMLVSEHQTPWQDLAPYMVLLVFFAPLIETLFVGQINTFVTLAIVMCLWFDARDKPIPAGICLGIAVLLKTSPIILLLYFFTMRRFRVIVTTFITLAVLSLFTLVQFGPQVYSDFLSVSGFIVSDRNALNDVFNQSSVAVTFRILTALQLPASSEAINWIYRLILIGVLVPLVSQAWRGHYAAAKDHYRFFFIGAILIIMTMLSPLVWFAHNVFLLLPLGLALLTRPQVGLAILFLMQTERLFYNFISVSVGHLSMDALPLALAFTAGTLTFTGQCWLLYLMLQGTRQQTLHMQTLSDRPIPQAN